MVLHIDTTKSRILELIESTLQLSNLDLIASYVLKGGSSATLPATSRVQNDILNPALADAQGGCIRNLLRKDGHPLPTQKKQYRLETFDLLRKLDQLSLRVIENFSASAASKLFEREVREAFLGTFGGLGAAGLSASLLTPIVPATLEDLLALGLCSAGGLETRNDRKGEKDSTDALAWELADAMHKDLQEITENLEKFVRIIGVPYLRCSTR
ncbi:hypothetical protein CRYUN_Cryun20dG0073200 [Craigia yunnanensis]